MLLPLGGRVAYLVMRMIRCAFWCTISARFPSLLPLVISPAIFQLLCLTKDKKRQKPWMQAEDLDPVTINEAGVVIRSS